MANSSKKPDNQYGHRPGKENQKSKAEACTPLCPYDTRTGRKKRSYDTAIRVQESSDAVLSSDPEVLNSSTVLPLDLFTSQRRTVVGRVLMADTHNSTLMPKRTKHQLQSLVTDVTKAAERQQEVEGKRSGNRASKVGKTLQKRSVSAMGFLSRVAGKVTWIVKHLKSVHVAACLFKKCLN